jgi:membrane-bound metal-dependent hydrolase YbcI (DUF457 family)
MASPTFTFIKGSTFSANCTYTPDAGWPTDLTDVSIYSKVRDARGYEHTLIFTLTSPTTFTLFYGNTQSWFSGVGFWDLLFIKNGIAYYSQVVNINVLENVTPNS